MQQITIEASLQRYIHGMEKKIEKLTKQQKHDWDLLGKQRDDIVELKKHISHLEDEINFNDSLT